MGPASNAPIESPCGDHGIVLDTNVVLDWLVFSDTRAQRIAQAVSSGAVAWLATDGMLAEAMRMFAHPSLARWRPDVDAATATCLRHARLVATPSAPLGAWPRCTDRDDQPFVELAIAERARWLVSRDRALLKLRRRMAGFGVAVVTPDDWRHLD